MGVTLTDSSRDMLVSTRAIMAEIACIKAACIFRTALKTFIGLHQSFSTSRDQTLTLHFGGGQGEVMPQLADYWPPLLRPLDLTCLFRGYVTTIKLKWC